MPIMDGYTFIKKIKTNFFANTHCSSNCFYIQGDKEKLLMAGFDYYISKPIDMAELHKVLKVSL